MNDYYDKNGKPIGLFEWAKLLEDKDYRIIKQETLKNSKFISTVWLGLNHNFGEGEPLIFETMVFNANKKKKFKLGSKKEYESIGEETDMDRYSTLEEAIKGHQKMVKKWDK